jgi:hypothetical protein
VNVTVFLETTCHTWLKVHSMSFEQLGRCPLQQILIRLENPVVKRETAALNVPQCCEAFTVG